MNYFKEFVKNVGTHQLASEQLGVSRAYVTQMLLGRKKVSFKIARRVESLTSGKITRKDLRPDIYG
jgi:DNA-binding transcriptional regulator YdaS (Cro superfamily)